MPGDSNTSRFNISHSVYYANNNNTGSFIPNNDYANQNYAITENYAIAEAAAEIQKLLDQVSQTYPTTTSKDKMIVVAEVVDQIENNPTLQVKVINSLKAGGREAFKEAIDNPLVNILMAVAHCLYLVAIRHNSL